MSVENHIRRARWIRAGRQAERERILFLIEKMHYDLDAIRDDHYRAEAENE
jgi:hypothetical protein